MHAIFMAEAGEIMTDLEKVMMKLEADGQNKEAIGQAFRDLHTLKGSAGMFGLEAVNRLCHHLESIYEGVRADRYPLTAEMLKVTFACIDHLKDLLAAGAELPTPLVAKQSELLAIIERTSHAGPAEVSARPQLVAERVLRVHYLHFAPEADLLHRGTNTLYLVDDLMALGKGVALPYFTSPPSLDTPSPGVSITHFEMLLETDRTEADLRDVFMFVGSGSALTIKPIAYPHARLTDALCDRALKGHRADKAQGFEVLQALFAPAQAPAAAASTRTATQNTTIRVDTDRLDELLNLVSELVTTQARLSLFSGASASPELESIGENVESITRRLRDNAFDMSMVPIETLVVRFQRLVRDLSKELGKAVVLVTDGTDTRIDRSIIEQLTDPLLHILRNALDHGLETPEERSSKGKPIQGTITLRSYSAGANVIIEISDDGAGINVGRVRAKAVAQGLIAEDAQLAEADLIDLIFRPGFSTAEKVSDVSGRGVGMDVVRRNITAIRGDVRVSTRAGQGTLFTIRLPLTLSIIDGLLVRVGTTDLIIPLGSVGKCFEVNTAELAANQNQWTVLDGARTPYFMLRRDMGNAQAPPALSQLIRIPYEHGHVGLVVDRIVGEYQAVLKPLGELHRNDDEFSGATILGDGSVALVVDPHRMIHKRIELG